MDSEIWRDVDGYEDYQVSNFGRVRSFKSGTPRILKPGLGTSGYFYVNLCRDGRVKNCKVHRLVAEAFISNPEGKPQVNHVDGNKLNNRADNLEWVTQCENIQHAYDTGLRGSNGDNPLAKLTNAQVVYIRENPDGLTCAQLGEMFGVRRQVIAKIQTGRSYKNAGGKIRKPKPQKFSPKIPDDVRDEIRRLYKPYSRVFGSRALARRYGCSMQTIRNIVNER